MIYLEPRSVYDNFIIGVAEGIDVQESCLIYSKNKIINYLVENMGEELIVDHNEKPSESVFYTHQQNTLLALEYFEYNIAGAYLGPSTPIFASTYEEGFHD